ncbi:MAG: SDR family oxidoreductase, partial [Singulisphaera sp.]
MRVFVTGGYGCIGSWVAKRLVQEGQEVWIYDLKEDTHRLDLLLDADEKRQVHFLPGDVADPISVRAAIERVEATHVLHLAGLQTPTCRANPILGATVNVIGTLAIFEAAVALRDQVRRVVYASSAAVHGPAEGEASGPLGDEVRLAPMTHYGAYKVCNELNARVYWLDQGITSVGLRPWTVYGVGRDFGMTSEPTKAIKAVAAERPYRISYGGLQDLQYVGDVADVFLCALSAPFEGADAFNIRGAVVPIETFAAT